MALKMLIPQLLTLTRPLFVLDTETTGTDTKADRIVELAFQKWEPVSDAAKAAGHDGMTKEWRSLVDPGVPISASATRVHGITNEDMRRCTKCRGFKENHLDCVEFHSVPTFKQLAANLAKGLSDCDFCGQNIRFDLRILAAEFARAGVEWGYAKARVVDSYQLERLAVPRSLSHLHEKYMGKKHDGAHGALSDVRASAMVIVKQLETHASLPRDLDALHAAQWPGEIDSDGKFRFINGVPCVAFGKWNGKPMKSVDISYWDWICSSEFSTEVKAIAGRAKLGQFPVSK